MVLPKYNDKIYFISIERVQNMASLTGKFKSNNILRRAIKTIKIYYEYMYDAANYSKYYMESAKKKGNYKYAIMIYVHNIEKGMCTPEDEVRPFGYKKAVSLKKILSSYPENSRQDFEYQLAVSALKAWVNFHEEHNWVDDKVKDIKNFVAELSDVDLQVGSKIFDRPTEAIKEGKFCDLLATRHSVRDFEPDEIKQEDLDFALKCFVDAPTACNRQMCKVYQVKNSEVKELLNKTVLGVGGFNKDFMNYFIITYDTASLLFYGERNQGYFNAGLVGMNFVNGLHARGIGSCFMQWANKKSEDILVRKALKLPESERIAVVIGAGYYKEKSIVACSCRKPVSDIFRVVE